MLESTPTDFYLTLCDLSLMLCLCVPIPIHMEQLILEL